MITCRASGPGINSSLPWIKRGRKKAGKKLGPAYLKLSSVECQCTQIQMEINFSSAAKAMYD